MLSERQHDLLRNVPVEDIPHGTRLDPDMIDYYLRSLGLFGSFVLELGTGDGKLAGEMTKREYGVMALDINPNAIREAKKHTAYAYVGDAVTFEISGAETQELFHNRMGGVVMQALLCNVIAGQWRRVLHRGRDALVPRGFFFISDVLRADQYNPELELPMGEHNRAWYLAKWFHRYNVNNELGLPFGEVAVAKPGPLKFIEWGSFEEVRKLILSPDLERYAHHFTVSEIDEAMDELGMECVLFQREIWRSRQELQLSGFVGVWQKK